MRRSSLTRMARRVFGTAFVVGVAAWLGIAGWRVCGRFGERCEEVGLFFPRYNATTKRIDLVMYDLNKNGLIDTWVYQKGPDKSQVDIDRDENGAIDRILILDGYRYTTIATRSVVRKRVP